jgi:hypothetical protein
VGRDDRVVAVHVAVLTQAVPEQLVTGHPDRVMEVGHRDVMAVLAQRLSPAHSMDERGVDESSVDVEKDTAR